MDFKEIFKRLILDAQQAEQPRILPRTYCFPQVRGKVTALTGPRRSGKTFLFQAMIQGLLQQGIEPKDIISINLEDSRLFGLEAPGMESMLQAYFEMWPENKDRDVYLFLDEVQAVPGWDSFVRRVLDSERMYVFVTGSSSSMLDRELSTSLRGRTLSFRVMPLSLPEYGLFHDIDLSDVFSSRAAAGWGNRQDRYMRYGGFPEIVYMPESLKRRTLRDYLDLMLYRDIVERFDVKNTTLFRHVLNILLYNMSSLVSVNRIFNTLKSQGHALSRDTLYDYFSYLEEAMLFYFVPLRSASVRKRQINPRKVYVLDQGFFWMSSPGLTRDQGRILENMVFIELVRQENRMMYLKGRQETDFLAVSPDGRRQLIQVCLDMSRQATRERELSALVMAMEEEGVDQGLIITASEQGETIIGNKRVEILPFWRWALSRYDAPYEPGYTAGRLPGSILFSV
ncbi:MAG: ATP-binding protein [Desulfonatronovibrionaceae bacterium]